MPDLLFKLLVFILVCINVVLIVDNGESYVEEKDKKTASSSEICLAPARQRFSNPFVAEACPSQVSTAIPSLERSYVATDHRNHNEDIKRSMEMPELSQTQQIQHQLLRRMWRTLGRLYGSVLCPSQSKIADRPVNQRPVTQVSISPEVDLQQLASKGALDRRRWLVHWLSRSSRTSLGCLAL